MGEPPQEIFRSELSDAVPTISCLVLSADVLQRLKKCLGTLGCAVSGPSSGYGESL